MQKNKISLVGTTQGGRNFEVERLLDSLIGTTDFLEIVFVDQSGSKKTKDIVEKYNKKVNIKYLESEKVSLSKARNLALKEVSGNIIGFCDDDAFYDRKFLEIIAEKSWNHPFVASFPIYDIATMETYGGRRYPKTQREMGFLSVIKYSSSVGTFLFLDKTTSLQLFDERLGAGAMYGGSEETEYFFRMMSLGCKGIFFPFKGIYHDNDDLSLSQLDSLSLKYKLYAEGYAVVIKKYLFESKGVLLFEVFSTIIRACAGIVFKSEMRSLYKNRLKGFLNGLLRSKL